MILNLKQGFSERISRSIMAYFRNRNSASSPDGTFWRINSFDYDNIKIEVDIGGGKRTIDLADLKKVNPSILVSERLDYNNQNGLPTRESILREAARLLEELKEELLISR